MGWSPKRYFFVLLIGGVALLQAEIKKPAETDTGKRLPLKVNISVTKPRGVKSTPKGYKGVLHESFESGVIPDAWTIIDGDGDGNKWGVYDDAAFAHTGTYSAAVRWNSSGNDDWLITPALLPQTGDSITFWARSHSATYLEDFDVLISTTTTDTNAFILIDSVRALADTYSYFAYDLSSYAGDTIYVAIRCVSQNEFYLHVDDFSGPELLDTIPPQINIVLAPNPHFYTGTDDVIAAVISDISGIASAEIRYSTDLGNTWTPVQMVKVNGDTFMASIPAQAKGNKILWYVYAQDSSSNDTTTSAYYYTIMPSGNDLVSFSDVTEAYPLIYALIDLGIDPLPDYMFRTDFYTYQDSLSYWKSIYFGETGGLGDTLVDVFDKFLSTGNDTSRKSVIIFGDDIAYYANSGNYLDKLHSVFRITYIQDDYSTSTDNDTIEGVVGDPISEGIPTFTVSSNYPDMVEPWSPWDSVDMPWKFLIVTTGDSTNTAGGVAYNGLEKQVFYMPYEVSEIDSQSAVDTLIGRIHTFIENNILPPMPDWCGIQWPQADTVTYDVDTLSDVVYGQVYKGGVTDVGVQDSSNFIVELGVGPAGTMPDDENWKWVRAVFNTAHGNDGNNYEYMAQIDVRGLTPGVYDYAFRFSYNGGPWVYADWGSSGGSNDGYQPENAGKLYVVTQTPMVSIYEIQDTTDTTFAADTSDYFGQTVTTFGIVTGVYSNGFFLEDQAGGAWSGLWVYLNGADTLYEIGDSLIVEGGVTEYHGLTELSPDTIFLIKKNTTLPVPVVVNTGAANDESYEGVLLRVIGATCTNPDLGYGEWEVNDGSGALRVDDMGVAYTPDSGAMYNITAPLYYSYGNYKLEPRDSADIVQFTYPQVVINEVYYDAPGTDAGVFVELKAAPGTSLDNIHVWGVNGADGSVYSDVDLTGHTVGPRGYFVLAQDSTVPNADTITGLDYQNGPDNVVLVYIDGSDTTVLDALGYGSTDTTTWVFVGEGVPAPDVTSGLSLQRIPDGSDTNDNSVDFVGLPPTPGRKNATYVIFEDNFDDDTLRWTGNWAKTGLSYHSPDSSFTDSPTGNYPDNSVLVGEINQDIDLTSYYSAKMEFWTKYAIEEGWDSVHLQISTDSGATWTDIKAYTGNVSDWTKETVDLGAYAGKVIRLRFVLISDAAVNYDGMYVDDVVISGSMIDNGAPAIHHKPPTLRDDILGDFVAVASIIDPSPIAIDSLYYRADTMSSFVAIAPDSMVDTLSYFTIPAQRIGARVDYYFVAADTARNRTQTEVYTYYQGVKFIYDDDDPQYYMPMATGSKYAVSIFAPADTGVAISAMMVLHYYSPGQGVTGGAYIIHVYDNTFNDIITPDTVYEDTTMGNVFWKVIDLTALNNGEPIYLSYNDTIYLGVEGIDTTVALMLDQPSSGYYHTYVYNADSAAWYLVDADLFIRAIGDYVSDAKENLNKPLKFAALAPMPNPFRGHTVIKFALPAKERVTLDIYDINGRRITRLLNGKLNAGWHTVSWNGRDARGRKVKSGVYFYKLNAGKYRKTVKMLLVR